MGRKRRRLQQACQRGQEERLPVDDQRVDRLDRTALDAWT
jgi:hypothetical protein